MLSAIDTYFMAKEEPVKSCLLFLRQHILQLDKHIVETWSYGMPFYLYRERRFCYLWLHKKHEQPYIGFVDGQQLDHPQLLSEKRSRMKILLIDPNKDVPLETVNLLLKAALRKYA